MNTASGTSTLFGKTVVAIASGGNHCLALCSDGTLAAWGFNSNGQVGDNSTTNRMAPVAGEHREWDFSTRRKIVAMIAGGVTHSLVLCTDGSLAAWGGNSSGQVGDNSTTNRLVPTAVNTASGVRQCLAKQ